MKRVLAYSVESRLACTDKLLSTRMKPDFRLLLTALVIAIGALIMASVWAVRTGWRQVAEVSEGLRIAERVDVAIVQLTGELYRAELAADAAQWQRFLADSRALASWIDEQKPLLRTKHERELLDRVAADFARYLAAATGFAQELGPGRVTAADQARIVGLLDQLGEVRRQGVGQFLVDSHRFIATLQTMNLALLATTAVFAAWLLFMGYRRILVPLRRQLGETGDALEHAQKLASLGLLASGVAHEIRNPLTAIKARLYTHQKLLARGTPEHEDCDFIGEEITRLERIVRDFLQFARPSEPLLAAVSPADLLREVQELLAPALRESSIDLAVESTVETAVRADRHQVKQVLINLVRNAAESIGEHGQVALRARETRLPLGDRPAVALEVQDTGRGLPPEVQKRLFDPFFTTKPSGTGLGLSIAARIVQRHGGVLEFQTHPGRGATFRIVLPAETSA